MTPLRRLLLPLAVPLLLLLAACGSPSDAATGSNGRADTLRLGFFANVTHAPALVADANDLLGEELGGTELRTQVFNAGPNAVEAMFGGALDASYIGPNPAVNGFVRSDGDVLRVVAGSTSGGASLVVRPGIDGPADLAGTTIASPQRGNTQDVALRAWLAEQGYETTVDGAGDVTIAPQDNATTLQAFEDGAIDGAWVPEPWASRLVLEAGAEVLVDERGIWPGGRFVTTQLVVRTEFLEEFPETVRALLTAHVRALRLLAEDPEAAKADVNARLAALAGAPLADEVIDRAWANLEFTADPVAASLQESADDAAAAGLVEAADLTGIFDLSLLGEVLAEAGLPAVDDAGLGVED